MDSFTFLINLVKPQFFVLLFYRYICTTFLLHLLKAFYKFLIAYSKIIAMIYRVCVRVRATMLITVV